MTTNDSLPSAQRPTLSTESFLLSFALFKLLLHMAVNVFGAYGYFRDEFYYLACSEHLDWGYVDQPPLSIALLTVSRFIFGDSLVGLRFLPALAGAAMVYVTGLMTRELGGGRFAQALACVAAIASPIFLAMNSIYSMNSFDILLWTLTAYLLVRLFKTESPRLWIWIGVVLGLGLLNKISVLWLGLGIAVGLVATPQRQWLRTKWPWTAAGIAVLVFLPYVLWNAANDFAHLEFIRNATGEKYSSLTRAAFAVDQIAIQNPGSVYLWLAGLWYFFMFRPASKFRVLGYVYVTAFLVLLINGASKAEYLSPAYGMLFAGGGVFVEQFIQNRSWNWARPVLIGIPAVIGVVLMPLVLTVLPVDTYIRYTEALGVAPSTAENKQLNKLPQFYADMFGWEELTTAVLVAYESLPIEDHGRCVIYTQNYGEAGAISFLGQPFGVPPVVSGHNNYYLWGPGKHLDSTTVVIIVGGNVEDHRRGFEEVEYVAHSQSKYAMPYENNLPIFVCRRLKKPIEEVWPRTKNYS